LDLINYYEANVYLLHVEAAIVCFTIGLYIDFRLKKEHIIVCISVVHSAVLPPSVNMTHANSSFVWTDYTHTGDYSKWCSVDLYTY